MKTVVVIGLLSMVMYGVYTVLTEPDPLALENKPAGSSPVDLGASDPVGAAVVHPVLQEDPYH